MTVNMTQLLPSLTDITTTRDVDTPYGAIPAGTAGTIAPTTIT